MVVFIIKQLKREADERIAHKKAKLQPIVKDDTKKVTTTKKELVMAMLFSNTKLSLKEIAEKVGTSYQNVKNIHSDYLRIKIEVSK